MRAMRDEVLGSAYEILAELAILQHTTLVGSGEHLFAQKTPIGAGIKPDLTIGTSADSPRVLIQIHHTNAERASEKKFWRNVGEFVDARLTLGSETLIITLAFDSGQKRRLSVASEKLMDGFLEADRQEYGHELLAIGTRLATSFHSKKVPVALRLSHAQELLRGDNAAQELLSKFGQDVQAQVALASAAGKSWYGVFSAMQQKRSTPRVPKRKLTTLRRALGRLLPIGSESELRSILDSARHGTRIDWPEYLVAVGVAARGIGVTEFIPPMPAQSGRGAKKLESDASHELAVMLSQFDDEVIVGLWKRLRGVTTSLKQATQAIRSSLVFHDCHSFVLKSFNELTSPSGMKQALGDCYSNPSLVLGIPTGVPTKPNQSLWLFEYLMTVYKAVTGKQQGYGYTRLGDECGFRFEIAATAGVVLSPYLQRTKPIQDGILTGIAGALARKLEGIGQKWLEENELCVSQFFLKGRFEDGVYKTAAFDPCFLLITDALEYRATSRNKRTPTFLSSFMQAGAATCDVLVVDDVAIMWQSATHQGVDHKTKELVGRVGMLRVRRGTDGVVLPMDVKKVLLVIDGTWTQSQLERLATAGFDGIYYCDELELMVKEQFD